MAEDPFVPAGFEPPRELVAPRFRLVPLGEEHNASDHAAWTSSIEHIAATPGFAGLDWPPEGGMSLERNREDLAGHARDFADRTGFTYTVLAPAADEVIGCVYIYPLRGAAGPRRSARGCARTSPTSTRLAGTVSRWLAERWPFTHVEYAPR